MLGPGAVGHVASMPTPEQDDGRWESSLPPDLPRAAPEIYRSMRATSASNVREWLTANYYGDKSMRNAEWVDFWNAATELDFALRQLPTGVPVSQYLAGNDAA